MSRTGRFAALAAAVAAVVSVVGWQTVPVSDASVVALDGGALFQIKGCASCHSGPDTTALTGSQFPSLVDVSAWAEDRRPGLSADEYLAESILEPSVFRSPAFVASGGPTTAMPDLRLSEVEVQAVVTYLLSG